MADLLKAEIETIKSEGIQSVSLAGLPDSLLAGSNAVMILTGQSFRSRIIQAWQDVDRQIDR